MSNKTKLVLFIGSLTIMLGCCISSIFSYAAGWVEFGHFTLQFGVVVSFLFISITAYFASTEWDRK